MSGQPRHGSSGFRSETTYAELEPCLRAWRTLREEALAARPSMFTMDDTRVDDGRWTVLPLVVEEEDRSALPGDLCGRARAAVPKTWKLLRALPGLRAASLSCLAPGGYIRPHRHEHPLVTAALCLQEGGGAWIKVEGEKRMFREGEALLFDYRRLHEVRNDGAEDRVVLLILLELRD